MLAIMKNIFIVSLIVLAAADDGLWFSYFLPYLSKERNW
jgi:hypothetical protein